MSPYIKSFIAFLFFILYNVICKFFVKYLVINGYISISSEYSYIVNIAVYFPLLLVLFVFSNNFLKQKSEANNKSISHFIYTIFFCIGFKVFTMPLAHLSYMYGNRDITSFGGSYSLIFLVLSFLSMVILIPFVEEFFFRKILISFFPKGQLTMGILFSSVLFLLSHYDYKQSIGVEIFNILFLGLLAGILYVKYGFIYNFAFHSFYNFLWFLLNIYKKDYLELLMYLNFDYRYWLVILFGLAIFVFLLRKLELLSIFTNNKATQ